MTRFPVASWWRRPCGGREVLALALPLVVSTASWAVMNFADRMFLLWHSTEAMAAAMPAGMLYFTMLCLPLGLAAYVNTFVAQYKGAGRPERIGLAVWQGVWIGVLATPLFLATIPLAPIVFKLAGHTAEVARLEATYFQVLVFGAGGLVIAAALSSFFTGRGKTRVVMIVDTGASLLNIVLDYAWIFGHWGFPALGIAGAAWATVASQWFRVVIYWWLMSRPAHRQMYQLAAGRRVDPALLGRLLRYGGPAGLTMLIDVSSFTVFLLLVGRLGQDAMAATVLAFNVNNIAFVPMWGIGIAVSTMVGQQLGRRQPDLAARATWTALWMAGAYTGAIALLYICVPDLFLIGHALGTSPERFLQIRDVTVVLLRFVAAYCVLDAANVILGSAIKGAGDTRFVLMFSLIISPPPVLAAWAGVTYFGGGLIWCWVVVTAWIWTFAMVYLARFLQGRWRRMRVIEADLPTDGASTAVQCAAERA